MERWSEGGSASNGTESAQVQRPGQVAPDSSFCDRARSTLSPHDVTWRGAAAAAAAAGKPLPQLPLESPQALLFFLPCLRLARPALLNPARRYWGWCAGLSLMPRGGAMWRMGGGAWAVVHGRTCNGRSALHSIAHDPRRAALKVSALYFARSFARSFSSSPLFFCWPGRPPPVMMRKGARPPASGLRPVAVMMSLLGAFALVLQFTTSSHAGDVLVMTGGK